LWWTSARARVGQGYRRAHVCLLYSSFQISTVNAAIFGTDVLLRAGVSQIIVSKRIKQTISRHLLVIRLAAENFAVVAAYRHPQAAA
jgi:hypothetical protein